MQQLPQHLRQIGQFIYSALALPVGLISNVFPEQTFAAVTLMDTAMNYVVGLSSALIDCLHIPSAVFSLFLVSVVLAAADTAVPKTEHSFVSSALFPASVVVVALVMSWISIGAFLVSLAMLTLLMPTGSRSVTGIFTPLVAALAVASDRVVFRLLLVGVYVGVAAWTARGIGGLAQGKRRRRRRRQESEGVGSPWLLSIFAAVVGFVGFWRWGTSQLLQWQIL